MRIAAKPRLVVSRGNMSQILTATCWRNAFAVSSGQPPPLPHPGGRRVTGAVQGVVADRSGRSACGFAEEAGKFFATLKNTLAFVSKRITCLLAQPLGQFLVTRSGVFITTGFLYGTLRATRASYRYIVRRRLIVSSFVPKRKPHRPPSVSVKSVAGCCGSAPIYALRSVPRHQSSYRISVPHHLSDHRSFIVSGFFVLQWIAEAFFFASAFIVAVAVAVAVLAPSTSVLKRIDDFGGGARENKKKVRGN
jgi:hypothetical protein